MGGKSSSSSSQQTTTIQTDERIAATDNASVFKVNIDGSDNVLTDYEAIDKAGQLSLETINTLGQVALQSLTQTQSAVEVLGRSTDKTFEFVDDQNREEDNRTLTEIMPYLIAGVSIIALTGGFKLK